MIPFPNKKYSVIYADPPWSYQDKRCNGNAADHYPTMRIEDICSLPVPTALVRANLPEACRENERRAAE